MTQSRALLQKEEGTSIGTDPGSQRSQSRAHHGTRCLWLYSMKESAPSPSGNKGSPPKMEKKPGVHAQLTESLMWAAAPTSVTTWASISKPRMSHCPEDS
jgi:hypothetical protein